MRLAFTVFVELLASLLFLFFGLYIFYSGFVDAATIIKLPLGAAFIFGGAFAVYATARSRYKYRRLQRGEPPPEIQVLND